jgi:Asp-tRNA(Asn)/Glu-tRNA(Gln) amidotransferase A subunit family amidase
LSRPALPVTRAPNGLPVGIQLVARRGEKLTLVSLGHRLEQPLGGWLDPTS